MTGYALWAAVAGGAAAAGVVLVVAGILDVHGGPRPTGVLAGWRIRLRGIPGSRRLRTWGIAAAAGTAVWVVSGWPVAGIVTALAVPGLPYFFAAGRVAAARIDRLQALEEWVRRLADAMAAGSAPTQTIVASAQHPPTAIADPVQRLAGRLGSPRGGRKAALTSFADDLADPLGDMVAFALDIAITAPSARVPEVLRNLAGQLADDVAARRRIETDRAEPRSEARTIVIVQILFVIVVCAATSYTAAYDTLLGQVVLAVLAAVVVGALWMLRRLSLTAGPPRLINPQPHSQVSGAATAPGGPPARQRGGVR